MRTFTICSLLDVKHQLRGAGAAAVYEDPGAELDRRQDCCLAGVGNQADDALDRTGCVGAVA